MSNTIQLTDHDALDQLGAIVKSCPHCGKAPRIVFPMPGVSPLTLSNVMVNCCAALFWKKWQAERPADAEIAALRAERDALRHDMEVIRKGHEACERENDGLYATLTREPSEAEVERVAIAVAQVPIQEPENAYPGPWPMAAARAAIAAFIAGRRA